MGIIDLVFPKTCLGCGAEGKYLCADCVAKVRLVKPICPYCEKASIDGLTHAKCVKKRGLDGLVSVWEYEGVIRKAVLALKYKYSTEVGRELAEVFLKYLLNSKFYIQDSKFLIPVPLFWYRENNRGFNQSQELGKVIAERMGWGFVPGLLIRKRPTTPQVELSGDERKKNLKGVFSLNPTHIQYTIPNILLFDDVFTTGSTLHEATKVLKRGGVEKVWGLTIAR